MSLFISNAYAQAAPAGNQGGGFEMLIMLGIFGLIFILCCIARRPNVPKSIRI